MVLRAESHANGSFSILVTRVLTLEFFDMVGADTPKFEIVGGSRVYGG
jgi:hypothetical protein